MERMAQDVQVHLKTQVVQAGQVHNYKVDQVGQAVIMGDKIYVRYMESPEKQDNVKVIVKIASNNQITIKRKTQNQMTTNMMFDQVHDQAFDYMTDYGMIPLVSHTNNLQVLVAQAPISGQIKLDYSLHSGRQLVGNYKLQLLFS
ncbi:DUF1934 domain-containing protein [Bombilactobacillus folatiphilus]|uniref:DUF1934 domain-containing protein n=1 Tax=Bombilactobacillus folatiphilus TaxID=2923362 RepID=A0ABY4P9F0_9LACO|nr:DUF1934 domain-containing protein [Bombilactobacillus folatiphilus]UQS82313.1 DUF1934 domain-containing protein [Bombilactobacillus folatiphilus]